MESTHDEGAQVRHRPRCTLGEPSRARRAGRGRGPLGQGVDRAGAPPALSSLPAIEAANHQAGARPRRGLLWPRNSQTPSFAGKKSGAAGAAQAVKVAVQALEVARTSAQGPGHAAPLPSSEGPERKQASGSVTVRPFGVSARAKARTGGGGPDSAHPAP